MDLDRMFRSYMIKQNELQLYFIYIFLCLIYRATCEVVHQKKVNNRFFRHSNLGRFNLRLLIVI